MRYQLNSGATSETTRTWKTIHTTHALIYSNKANMKGWLWRPNDIRVPWGPKASWHLSYRWGKTTKNPHPGNLSRRGSNTGPLRNRRTCYRLLHSNNGVFNPRLNKIFHSLFSSNMNSVFPEPTILLKHGLWLKNIFIRFLNSCYNSYFMSICTIYGWKWYMKLLFSDIYCINAKKKLFSIRIGYILYHLYNKNYIFQV